LATAALFFKDDEIDDKLVDAVWKMRHQYGCAIFKRRHAINILLAYYDMPEEQLTRTLFELGDNGIIRMISHYRRNKLTALLKTYGHYQSSTYVSQIDQTVVKRVIKSLLFSICALTNEDIRIISNNLPLHKDDHLLKKKDYLWIFSGILLLLAGTLFYKAYFSGVWLFGIVLGTGIAHIFFAGSLTYWSESVRKAKLIACSLPIFVGFILNACIGFAFFSNTSRDKIAWILTGSACLEEAPWDITLMLLLVDIIGMIIVICLSWFVLFPTFADWKAHIAQHVKYIGGVSIIIMCGYVPCIVWFPIRSVWENHTHLMAWKEQKQTLITIVERNNQLKLSRANQSPSLAFKGIGLGMRFEQVDSICKIDSSCMVKNATYALPMDLSYAYDNRVDLAELINIKEIDHIECNFIHSFELVSAFQQAQDKSVAENCFCGQQKEFTTAFNNKSVTVSCFENMGKVGAILVTGYFDATSTYDLYRQKYGEPELLLTGRLSFPVTNNHSWTFKNGYIYQDWQTIFYIDDLFHAQLINQQEVQSQLQLKRQKQIEQEKLEKQQKETERKNKELQQQKEKEEENHRNAINDI
jgi:hypothetical protein